jgi:hypothetical protein
MIGDHRCTAPGETNVIGGKRSVTIAGPGACMPCRDGTGGIRPTDGGQRSVILIEPATDRGPHIATGVTTLSCRDGADAARIIGDGPHIGVPVGASAAIQQWAGTAKLIGSLTISQDQFEESYDGT